MGKNPIKIQKNNSSAATRYCNATYDQCGETNFVVGQLKIFSPQKAIRKSLSKILSAQVPLRNRFHNLSIN